MQGYKKWHGHYCQDGEHEMHIEKFNIDKKGKIKGCGEDDAGEFKFKGRVAVHDDFSFKAVKKYEGYKIHYHGQCDPKRRELTGHWGMAKGEDVDEFKLAAESQGGYKEWNGFYDQDGKHDMKLEKFKVKKSGKIKGEGSDDAGDFKFTGMANLDDHTFAAEKEYSSWTVHYFGSVSEDRTELWGHWGMAAGEPNGEFALFAKSKLVGGKTWEGHFCQDGDHEMKIQQLKIKKNNGKIKGKGTDDVGDFVFKGKVDLEDEDRHFKAKKKYAKHTVHYHGEVHEDW